MSDVSLMGLRFRASEAAKVVSPGLWCWSDWVTLGLSADLSTPYWLSLMAIIRPRYVRTVPRSTYHVEIGKRLRDGTIQPMEIANSHTRTRRRRTVIDLSYPLRITEPVELFVRTRHKADWPLSLTVYVTLAVGEPAGSEVVWVRSIGASKWAATNE